MWFYDQEIYGFVGDNLHLARNLSFRSYNHAVENRFAGQKWRDMLLAEWQVDKKMRAAYDLHNDESLTTDKAKAKAWTERGLGVERTYFRWKEKLLNGNGKPRGKPK